MDKFIFIKVACLFVIISCTLSIKTYSQSEKSLFDPQKGWISLFDGTNTKAWKGFNEEKLPAGWSIKDQCLITSGQGGDIGGDIITRQQFEDFELYLEWAISTGGNSGIFFHVLEGNFPATYATGPEYQLIDDVGFPQKLEPWQQAGANYAMHVAKNKQLKPAGEFNSSRIVLKDQHVVHFLNGEKIVEYDLWTEEWLQKVDEGKWDNYPEYGLARKGHIGLQDHGSEIKFKNIYVRDLTDKGTSIFNGKDLSGWEIYGTEKWYVENGEMICESGPDKQYGYLATEKDYKDFLLRVEFFQESNGNSGVFFRSSIEGTKITGWQCEVAPMGLHSGAIYESYGRGWLNQLPEEKESALKPDGWNEMVIKVKGNRVITWLNGRLMSDLTDGKIGNATGKIALQIHDGGGVKVKWRNIFIKELDQ